MTNRIKRVRPGGGDGEDAYGSGEPQFNAGTDTTILLDDLAGYALEGDTSSTPNSRIKHLTDLRASPGMGHDLFIVSNRGVDDPPGDEASHTGYWDVYRIGSPGRTGQYCLSAYLPGGLSHQWDSGKTYTPNESCWVGTDHYVCIQACTNITPPNASYWDGSNPNVTCAWIALESGYSRYSPPTATVALRYYIRMDSVASGPGGTPYVPMAPGIKFFEWWPYPVNGGQRIQAGGIPTDYDELEAVWNVSTDDGTQTTQFWVPSGNFPSQWPSGYRKWSEVNTNASKWWRVTHMFRAADSFGDTTGIYRGWVGGVKAWDLSTLGVSEGFCTTAQLQHFPTSERSFVKFPDTFNQMYNRSAIQWYFSDFHWWKVGA